ncbi:uncharacterized protein M6B38_256050 [Iris pallida]|uniref:Uncharacterized protein n=1 Tax=Iris pallida TaxID=29817 RepID=A0AAX6IGY2_IRIPA|nr:uncharacterized protein M6B38_256050 [Iris pallida]
MAPPTGEAQLSRPFLAAFFAVRRCGFLHLPRGSPPLRPLAASSAAVAPAPTSPVAPGLAIPGSFSKLVGTSARSYLATAGGAVAAVPASQAAEELVLRPRASVFVQGIPKVTFDEVDVAALAIPFKFALIGKLSHS